MMRSSLTASKLLLALLFLIFALKTPRIVSQETAAAPKPNFLIIFTDDQGYGDLGCYGATDFKTPRIDQLAKEGTRFTNFYAQIVCGPSRSALLTGRYPVRSLGWSMPSEEITIAERLKQAGYTTGCIGKWDVSNRAPIESRMPLAQGFDYFWGTLGANDGGRVTFHHNNDKAGETNDMASLTRRYTDKAIDFIKRQREQPFFLYLAHTMVHSVIDASENFKGKSEGGLYGDTIQELDFETGRLLDALDEFGLKDNTVVIFTSDNGPWSNAQESLSRKHDGQVAWGSSGPLREAKGSTYEGGLRVPCIVRWPDRVPASRVSDELFATIDFMPTFAKLAGFEIPKDRIIDGVDQSGMLLGRSPGTRSDYFYFCKGELHAVRKGKWKVILPDRRRFYGYVDDKGSEDVELYNLENDIGEKHDRAGDKPEIVRDLLAYAAAFPLPEMDYDDRIGLNRPQPSQPPAPLDLGRWQEHGLSAEQYSQIRSDFQDGVDDRFIPGGAMMIIHKGEVIFREAIGVADLTSERPFLADAPVRIASLTKLHTATVIAMLAEQGRLSLDEPIDMYLPEFGRLRVRGKSDLVAAPTLNQCLSHTAGFAGNNALKSGNFQLDLNGSLAEVVTALASKELVAKPGTRYAYSRLGYMTAARVAEVTTGRSFPQLMQRMLLEPVGAQQATFLPSEELKGRIPTPYVRTRAGFEPREGEPLGTALNPGGSLVSSLDDVARVLLLHRNKGRVGKSQIISAEMLQQMYQPQPATPNTGYGLGFNIMKRSPDGKPLRIRHTGASGTLAVLDFEKDVILIVLTQVPQKQTLKWRNRLVETVLNSF